MKICIVQPNLENYSETFIKAHAEYLHGDILRLHGGAFPLYDEQGQPVLPLGHAAINRGIAWALRIDPVKLDKTIQQYYPGSLREILLARRLRGVDVVLAEYGYTGAMITRACERAKVPLVVHFHGYDAYQYSLLERYQDAYREMFRKAAGIIAVSRHMREQLISLGAPPDRTHYHPYGVNLERFQPCHPGKSRPVFLAVGRFTDKKAPWLTILAFARMHEQCPEARLVMIGTGELFEVCRRMAEALGLGDSVEFRGSQTHDEVAAAMREARALVQHSIRPDSGDSEGTPVGIIEAQCAGLPVIATRHAGIVDVVREEETGLLVDEGDMEGMATMMLRLARDAELAGRMGRSARDNIGPEFAMERRIAVLQQILGQAADKNR